jgi:hypothetical protein
MELLTILAADYANIAEGGKLNVMGIFRNIYAAKFPAKHASMHLVIKLGAELGETGGNRRLTVLLEDEDGKEILKLSNNVTAPTSPAGQSPEINAIFQFQGIVFQKPGMYQFVVIVDDDYKGYLPIGVGILKTPGKPEA